MQRGCWMVGCCLTSSYCQSPHALMSAFHTARRYRTPSAVRGAKKSRSSAKGQHSTRRTTNRRFDAEEAEAKEEGGEMEEEDEEGAMDKPHSASASLCSSAADTRGVLSELVSVPVTAPRGRVKYALIARLVLAASAFTA